MSHHSPFCLHGQHALITGASGGIGSAIAKAFYSAGATITISGTNMDRLNALKADIETTISHDGDKLAVHVVPCDLSNPTAIDSLDKNATETMGGLEILINNAGITKDNLLMRMKDEDWQKVIDVNLGSCFHACRAAIKTMMSKRNGKIINIASVVGVTGNPGQTNYCASKAGMIGMSKALAQEVGSRGITVNCIAPGFIASNMTDVLPDGVKEKILSNIPMNRMGNPDEIANTAIFLASSAGSYITGQTLHVNGGMAMI
ncbi:MAG: 3-oxoacyl-[acyl-carrier-protein] reductase [Alphaproteobacteria bacterium]|nr:3-oxoacyl-[acyl-carrier-protein] reductase [Alphaproteobacteria bacterium]